MPNLILSPRWETKGVWFFTKLPDTRPGKSGVLETFSFQTLRLWFEPRAVSWAGLEEQPRSARTAEPFLRP